jgi:hypothetical protein
MSINPDIIVAPGPIICVMHQQSDYLFLSPRTMHVTISAIRATPHCGSVILYSNIYLTAREKKIRPFDMNFVSSPRCFEPDNRRPIHLKYSEGASA